MLHWRPHWQLCGGFNKVGDVVGEASNESDIPKSTMCHDKVSSARFEGCKVVSMYSTALICDVSAQGRGRLFSSDSCAEGSNSLRVPSSLF